MKYAKKFKKLKKGGEILSNQVFIIPQYFAELPSRLGI